MQLPETRSIQAQNSGTSRQIKIYKALSNPMWHRIQPCSKTVEAAKLQGLPPTKNYPVIPNSCSGLLLINSHKENLQNSTFFQLEHWLSHDKDKSKYLNFPQDDLFLQSESPQGKNPHGGTQTPTHCQPNPHQPALNTTFNLSGVIS